ncbi:MAG: class I mannose-6-phosphate isomerase [Candidatus Hydrogenedentes bacterium]|nr:class I mannose-6-phosphate isomerase [Candidatus Hydrogenedentota bacterium]
MSSTPFGLLQFSEQYFERIWGGQRLNTLFQKPIPGDKPIGEAWLISDHPSAVSVVRKGPHAGRTLHDLIEEDADALIGSRSKLTPHGRFPLLLKLLDSTDVLSVQVHPDDDTAAALGEPDVGKTEMWHILHADPGAELFCGLEPGTTSVAMKSAIEHGALEQHLTRFKVVPGDSVFVAAGTVHAIGAGIVLAEIQQNSDLTYRLYDWNRVDTSGKARELHIEKGLRATRFDCQPVLKGEDRPKQGLIELAASKYFEAHRFEEQAPRQFSTNGRFIIVLAVGKHATVSIETEQVRLQCGECCLIPACISAFTLDSNGPSLIYAA